MKRVIAMALLAASICGAEDGVARSSLRATDSVERPAHKRSRFWLLSIGVLVAANIVDAHSSWGYPERNGLLASRDGRFGMRAIGIKSALIGGVIGAEWIASRKVRAAQTPFATANIATAGMLWRAAANNYRVRDGFGKLPAR